MSADTIQAASSMETEPSINEAQVLNPAKKAAVVGGDGQAITPLTPVRRSAAASFGATDPSKSKPRAGKAMASKRKASNEFVDDGKSFTDNFFDIWEKVTLKISHSEAVYKALVDENPNDPMAKLLQSENQSNIEIINLLGNMNQNMAGKLDMLVKRSGVNCLEIT